MASVQPTLGREAAVEEGLLENLDTAAEDSQDEKAGRPRAEGPAPTRCMRRKVGALAAGSVLVLALLGIVAFAGHAQPPVMSSESGVKQGVIGRSAFESLTSMLSTLRDGIKAADILMTQANASYHNITAMVSSMQDTAGQLSDTSVGLVNKLQQPGKWRTMIKQKLKNMNATQKAHLRKEFMKKYNITSWKKLRPEASLSDGNPCPDDEEFHQGLCYSRCSDLTGGKFPFRTAAGTCCKHEACSSVEDSDTNLKVCGGYDTSKHALDGCPHVQGSCLLNEELFAGYCYKKCALITFGVLPHRTAAASCCNSSAKLAFLDFEGCDTDANEYAIGGGQGNTTLEPREVHPPILGLVES